MYPSINNFSAEQLRAAAEIKERIETLQGELDQLLGTSSEASPGRGVHPKRRKFSRATIARMRASQVARWAARRAIGDHAKPRKRGRRRLSKAAKARLSLIAKARWKKAHAAGKTTL